MQKLHTSEIKERLFSHLSTNRKIILIKVDLTEMRSYCVGLIQIVQDRGQCWILVNTLMKLSIL